MTTHQQYVDDTSRNAEHKTTDDKSITDCNSQNASSHAITINTNLSQAPTSAPVSRMPSFAVQMFNSKDLAGVHKTDATSDISASLNTTQYLQRSTPGGVSPSIAMSSITSHQDFLYNFNSAKDDVCISIFTLNCISILIFHYNSLCIYNNGISYDII